jgi:hypothetical protein
MGLSGGIDNECKEGHFYSAAKEIELKRGYCTDQYKEDN